MAAGTVGYFYDQSSQPDDSDHRNVGFAQVVIDMGIYGRHEFFLSALAIGFLVAISSLAISAAGVQDKIGCAVMVSFIYLTFENCMH